MTDDCFLCRAATGSADIPWTDRPLWLDSRSGLLVPGLGGFAVGYVLLAPTGHLPSLGSAAQQGPGFPRFVEEVLSFLFARIGPLTYWEHGSGWLPDTRRSACVEHAHLHIVPGLLPLPRPPGEVGYPGIGEALEGLAAGSDLNAGYLLLGHREGRCFVGRDVQLSQYYRREWARTLGRSNDWDYLLAEDPEITRETIRVFLSA